MKESLWMLGVPLVIGAITLLIIMAIFGVKSVFDGQQHGFVCDALYFLALSLVTGFFTTCAISMLFGPEYI